MKSEAQTTDSRSSPLVTVGIPTYNRAGFLQQAIDSVLSQTFSEFRLLISDNASQDETSEVVASFVDSRVEYIRSTRNIGMIGNLNRLIESADTDLLVLLPDDDLLHRDYLSSVVKALQQFRTVGVVHTAFDLIDAQSHVHGTIFPMKAKGRVTFEPGERYLERSMTATWPICFSSAIYRTRAIREAGGLKEEEQPFADMPMWMRIAVGWDFAYVPQSLVSTRDHPETVSRGLERRTDCEVDDRERTLLHAQSRFERSMGFLDQAGLPKARTARYRALATLRRLVERSAAGTHWVENCTELVRLARSYPRILLRPVVWRLLVAQLGGRRIRRALVRRGSLRRAREA